MKAKQKTREQAGPSVPAYIVTFSDMVTLLLTFFVMLLSLAQTQEEKLFYQGQESFFSNINNYGLGMLQGKNMKIELGQLGIKYPIKKPDKDFKGRTIDERNEQHRRIIKKLTASMHIMPLQIIGQKASLTITNIKFPPGSATLDEKAKTFLTNFLSDLKQTESLQPLTLYILALAPEEPSQKKQWYLSAERAKSVSDFLKKNRPQNSNWYIYSWGAGPGGEWVNDNSPLAKNAQIFIATIRPSNTKSTRTFY